MIIKITSAESVQMRTYIEQHCAIHLDEGKEYLIESQLSNLVIEYGCSSFSELYDLAINDSSNKIRPRIVEAMTTNETYWFRDDRHWKFLRSGVIPNLITRIKQGENVRIWSCGCSTGQETYSLTILLLEEAERRGIADLKRKVELIGTDLSSKVLFHAISGRYDAFAMRRGIQKKYIEKYFVKDQNVWVVKDKVRDLVSFKYLNLQAPFPITEIFNLVLCRYVAIYFSDAFKHQLFNKLSDVVHPGDILLLGATESLRGYTDKFDIESTDVCTFNRRK